MEKQVHPNEITFMKKEFARLEKAVNEGFDKNDKNLDALRAEIRILSRSYVSKEEMKEETQKLCDMVDKKADIWVQKAVAGFFVMVVVAFLTALITLII